MVSTGTDIKPLEVLLFMRPVQSRVLFEQMLGRGTRVIGETDLQAVTPDTRHKTHFVIVDAVGVVEHPKLEAQTMERQRTVPFDRLLEHVACDVHDDDALTSLAGRLARLRHKLTEQDEYEIAAVSGGHSLSDLANLLLDAVDPDRHLVLAREQTGRDDPTPEEIAEWQQQPGWSRARRERLATISSGRTALQGNDAFLSGRVADFKVRKKHAKPLSPEELIEKQLNTNFRIMEQSVAKAWIIE